MSHTDIQREATKIWRLATAPLRRLPDFLIPGAPKCGTSSLFDLIMLHPQARRGLRKEPTNFIHYPTSVLRSRMNQPLGLGRFLCGDGSVEYFFHPDAPANAAAIVPNAKLIFLLRDPVERAWSEYRMFVKSGHERADFTASIQKAVQWLSNPDLQPLVESASRNSFNPVRYVRCGMYVQLLEAWEKSFSKNNTLVLFAEDFFSSPSETAKQVYSFLGLRPHVSNSWPHARDGDSKEQPPREAMQILREFYRPHNEHLSRMLGKQLPWH